MNDQRANSLANNGRLFDTRYSALASNTIDYWMLPDDPSMTQQRINAAIAKAPVLDDNSLQLYLHVPFCAQRCRFCAFSGGNALDFKQAEKYSRLVVLQIQELLNRTRIKGHPIRSVNIGGGSPDLVGIHIGHMLSAMRDLPGCTDETEFAVELTLSTTSREFIEQLVQYNVTKVSFGIQSLDPQVRRYMRQPKSLHHLDQILSWIAGRIPVINADLITGMPGQDLKIVQSDLRMLMDDSRINAISSYLLTPGAAPSLLAGLEDKTVPAMPEFPQQALMRLHTYETFLRNGWSRRGTNTYINPQRIDARYVEMLAGHECIGASHYEAFLLGAGPQSVSYMPGARVENQVNIKEWSRAIESGNDPFHLPKCSDFEQRDAALWVFPLRWEGLPQERFDRMVAQNALSAGQLALLEDFQREGLVVHTARGYELSILGEVFMGRLVRDLKKDAGQQAVDEYIREGYELGKAISRGIVADENMANNRQIAEPLLHKTPIQK